jgi:Mn-dependent DtxR family transcriptional regulator
MRHIDDDGPSAAMQEYLAEAYRIAYSNPEHPYISTSALAKVLGVSDPAVTRMVTRMKKAGYLSHEPYRGIQLTPLGERGLAGMKCMTTLMNWGPSSATAWLPAWK